MNAVYLITSGSVEYGHGDSCDITILETRESYGCGGYHPAFNTKEAALRYLVDIGKPYLKISAVEVRG